MRRDHFRKQEQCNRAASQSGQNIRLGTVFKYSLVLITVIGLMIPFSLTILADEHTLHIGCVFDLTAETAHFDVPILEGVRLGIQEINEQNGISGKIKIKLSVKDYRFNYASALSMTKKLLADGVNVVIGPAPSPYAIIVGKLCAKKGVPMLGPTITSPGVPSDIGPYGFNVNVAGNVQAAALARYAINQGYRRALILRSPDDAYTDVLPLYFARAFEKMGGSLVGQITYTLSQQEFSVEARKIRKHRPKPDLIMSSAFGIWYASLISSLRMSGIKTTYFGAEAIDEPSALRLGSVTEGVVFSTSSFATPGSSLDLFNQLYKKKLGKENISAYTALGYDSIKLIEAAVKKAVSVEGRAIRDALDSLENVQGASAKITYAGNNRNADRPVALCRMENGRKTLIKWVKPASEDIPPP